MCIGRDLSPGGSALYSGDTVLAEDIAVVVGSEIVFPADVHPNISLPANWSVVIRGQSGGTGIITLMVGVITQGDATITVT